MTSRFHSLARFQNQPAPQLYPGTDKAEQAAAEVSGRLGMPIDFVRAVADHDREGLFIRVMVTPELMGRLSLPRVYKGFRVALQRGFAP